MACLRLTKEVIYDITIKHKERNEIKAMKIKIIPSKLGISNRAIKEKLRCSVKCMLISPLLKCYTLTTNNTSVK